MKRIPGGRIVRPQRYSFIASLALAAMSVVNAGCPGTPGNPDADAAADQPDATMDAVAPGPIGLFARFRLGASAAPVPAPFQIPFPSDAYRDPDGTLRDDINDFTAIRVHRNGAALATAYRDLDGFGRNSGAMFVIDSTTASVEDPPFDVDPASLPADGAQSLTAEATAFAFDLDPALDATTARVPIAAGWQPRFRVLTVTPDGIVLPPGHRYAVVITTAVRSTRPPITLAASLGFVAIRDAPAAARADGIERLYGDAADRVITLMGAGFDRSRIAAMAVYTTQTAHRQLRSAAAAVRAGRFGAATPPTFDAALSMPFHVARFGASAHAGWTATLTQWLGTPLRVGGRDVPGHGDESIEGPNVGVAHDAIGVIATGTFELPDFRNGDGVIEIGADGAPGGTPRLTRIPVTIALPLTAPPATGYPVVIWGHGLRGHRRHVLLLANEFARRGIATVAIDTVTFGQRAVTTDETSIENGTYRGPDGIGDSVEYTEAPFFGNLSSLVAFRDNLRQAALDLVWLRRMIINPALDLTFVADQYGGRPPTFDPTHVAYAADSLGGLIGTLFGACDPEINPLVLNVPGGAIFTAIGTDSPIIGQPLGSIPALVFGAPSDAPADRFHPVFQLLQIALDRADPASHASDVTDAFGRARPHDVWMIESVWDEIIPNRSTELLARAMRLPQIDPMASPVAGLTRVSAPVHANFGMGATAAYFQSVPSTHGANIANRYGVRTFEPPFPRASGVRFVRAAQTWRIRQPIVATQRNIANFLATTFEGNATIAIDGMEPLVDLDDDGWTDDEERAAMTSPFDPGAHPSGTPPHTRDVGF